MEYLGGGSCLDLVNPEENFGQIASLTLLVETRALQ